MGEEQACEMPRGFGFDDRRLYAIPVPSGARARSARARERRAAGGPRTTASLPWPNSNLRGMTRGGTVTRRRRQYRDAMPKAPRERPSDAARRVTQPEEAPEPGLRIEEAGPTSTLHLAGAWQLGRALPSAASVARESPGDPEVRFDASELKRWDTGLIVFLSAARAALPGAGPRDRPERPAGRRPPALSSRHRGAAGRPGGAEGARGLLVAGRPGDPRRGRGSPGHDRLPRRSDARVRPPGHRPRALSPLRPRADHPGGRRARRCRSSP